MIDDNGNKNDLRREMMLMDEKKPSDNSLYMYNTLLVHVQLTYVQKKQQEETHWKVNNL